MSTKGMLMSILREINDRLARVGTPIRFERKDIVEITRVSVLVKSDVYDGHFSMAGLSEKELRNVKYWIEERLNETPKSEQEGKGKD